MIFVLRGIDAALLLFAAALSAYAFALGLGVVSTLAPQTYYADDWGWLIFNILGDSSSFCRLTGHPTVTANLLLWLNYHLLDGSAQARGIVTGLVHAIGFALIGALVVRRATQGPAVKAVILTVFAAVGLSGALSLKLFWSFGLTDGFVLIGAALVAHGLALSRLAAGWLLIIGGTLLAMLSFGSGLAIPVAVTWALAALGAGRFRILAYFAFATAAAALIMFVMPACEVQATGVGTLSFQPWTIIKTAAVTLGFVPAYVAGMHHAWTGAGWIVVWTLLGGTMILGTTIYAVVLTRRPPIDPIQIGLTAISLALIGAALLIGLTRSAIYGPEVGMQVRYAPITVAFWTVCFAILLRASIKRGLPLLRDGLAVAFSAMLVLAANNQLAHFLSFKQHLSISSIAVLFAAKTGEASENLKRYFAFTEWILKPLPTLVSNRKDLFSLPIGDGFALDTALDIDTLPACRGWTFPMHSFDEPGYRGAGGFTSSPRGYLLSHVTIYAGDRLVGAGLPSTPQVDRSVAAEARLLRHWRATTLRHFPRMASAFGIGAGWAGLARSDGITRLVAVGWSREGACRIAIVD